MDEGDPLFAPPSREELFGKWREDDVTEEIERIYLVRESAAESEIGGDRLRSEIEGDRLRSRSAPSPPQLEFYVKWKARSHLHCQWVPRTALEEDNDLNKRRVAKFLKQLATALADARAYAADAAADTAADAAADGAALSGSGSRAPLTRVESSTSAVLGMGFDERIGRAAVDVDGHPWEAIRRHQRQSRGNHTGHPWEAGEPSTSAVLGMDVDGHPWEAGEPPFNADYLEVDRVVAS